MTQACAKDSFQIPLHNSSTNVLPKNLPTHIKCFPRLFSSEDLSNNFELTDAVYEDVSDETLDSLTERFEDLGEESFTSDNFDVNYASGVMTIKLGDQHGTYVINKQSPNKQIWFSSPVSGPKRYDFVNGTWIYKYDNVSLHQRLTDELSEIYNTQIDFTNCVYGKPESA